MAILRICLDLDLALGAARLHLGQKREEEAALECADLTLLLHHHTHDERSCAQRHRHIHRRSNAQDVGTAQRHSQLHRRLHRQRRSQLHTDAAAAYEPPPRRMQAKSVSSLAVSNLLRAPGAPVDGVLRLPPPSCRAGGEPGRVPRRKALTECLK